MLALSLEGHAMLAASEGKAERAGVLFGAAEALREAIDVPMAPNDHGDYQSALAAARAALGAAAWANAWEKGRGLPLEQALQQALDGFDASAPVVER